MIGIFDITSLLFQFEASLDYIHGRGSGKVKACALRRMLESHYGIQMGEGLGRIQGTTFRIGEVDHFTEEEVEYFIESFEHCLN